MIYRSLLSRLFVILLWLPLPATALTVTLEGNVMAAGTHEVAEGTRINDLLESAGVDDNAFFLGASWYRESAISAQQDLKNGLLFDLTVLEQSALIYNHKNLSQLAHRLKQTLKQMPVTGRIQSTLDPAAVLGTPLNHKLENNDRIVFPDRPSGILITGATHHDCSLSFEPLETAPDYLKHCPTGTSSDKSWVYVIQPDGSTWKEGIGLWNSTQYKSLAPGAIIYIPFNENLMPDELIHINDDMAAFLATQVPFVNPEP